MDKDQKIKEVKLLSERVGGAKALIFAGYRGLKVSEMTDLRTKLRRGKSSLKVVKNRLMKKALKESGLEALSKYFVEPTAIASSDEDPISPAKVLVEFAKANGKFLIKGGLIDGRELSSVDIESLARLPSREVLISRAMASISSPATNMVGVLVAIPRKLLYALNAIKTVKGQQS